jgi:peptidoglycan/xylan/chitin deacetylase (PgdA/CDA1 family)
MDVLLRWTKPFPVDRPQEMHGSGRWSAVTFDDAFQSVVENALPELEKRGIPAMIFVPSGFLGKQAGWMERAGESTRIISEDTLRSLPGRLITIGSHTRTHPRLPELTPAEARAELVGSRTRLEEILGRPVSCLAFPFGRYNRETLELCREAGYERVFTSAARRAFLTPGEFVTGRVGVTPKDWRWEFQLKLLGAYEWVPAVAGWLPGSR